MVSSHESSQEVGKTKGAERSHNMGFIDKSFEDSELKVYYP